MPSTAMADADSEWYTPPELFESLGLRFALDPAAPPGGVPWVPARRHFCSADDGLVQPWRGRVWLNPPYGGQVARWLRRLGEHGDGIALVFARTDAVWFQEAAARASAVCLLPGRLAFVPGAGQPDKYRAPAGSALFAYGLPCALALAERKLGRTFWVPNRAAV